MVSVLLEYIDIFNQTLPIMLASYLMLLGTYYAQNYAGTISRSLLVTVQFDLIEVSNDYNYSYDLSNSHCNQYYYLLLFTITVQLQD